MLVATALLCAAAVAEEHVRILPEEIEFKPNPSWPGGPSSVLLSGDPKKAAPYSTRARIAANFRVMPHTHPDEVRMITVLSDTLCFGIGESFDESKLTPYTAGAFFTEPHMPHYSLTKDEPVVLQIFAVGPSGMNYVNPADDRRKRCAGERKRSRLIRQLTLFSASFEVYFYLDSFGEYFGGK